MAPVRRLMRRLEKVSVDGDDDVDDGLGELGGSGAGRAEGSGGCGAGVYGDRARAAAAAAAAAAVPIVVDAVTAADVAAALQVTRPSAIKYAKQYAEWNEAYGSH